MMKVFEREKVVRSTKHYLSMDDDPAVDEVNLHEHDYPMSGLYWAHAHEHKGHHSHRMQARRLVDKQGLDLDGSWWDWEEVK